MTVTWGRPYGACCKVRRGRVPIYLYRKGQRCRWYSAKGRQIGPEQANAAPALAWAYVNHYRDATGELATSDMTMWQAAQESARRRDASGERPTLPQNRPKARSKPGAHGIRVQGWSLDSRRGGFVCACGKRFNADIPPTLDLRSTTSNEVAASVRCPLDT